MSDPDSASRSINSYYIRAYDSKANDRDNKQFEMAKQDYLRSNDGGFGNMSEIEIAKAVESELPEGNMYRSDSKYYIYNYNEYGEKTSQHQSSESKTAQAVDLSIKNRRSGSGSTWEGNTLYGGGGFVGRGTDVRMSDGGSTALSIHKGPERYGDLKIGDSIGVRSKSWRRKYDADMRAAGVEGY